MVLIIPGIPGKLLEFWNFLPWPRKTPGISKFSSMAQENSWNFEIFFHGPGKLLEFWNFLPWPRKTPGKTYNFHTLLENSWNFVETSLSLYPTLQRHLTHDCSFCILQYVDWISVSAVVAEIRWCCFGFGAIEFGIGSWKYKIVTLENSWKLLEFCYIISQ